MKVIIDISKAKLKALQIGEKQGVGIGTLERAVLDGTPLPKGHGRLIDADDINNHIIGSIDTRDCPTIIEADKEVEQE